METIEKRISERLIELHKKDKTKYEKVLSILEFIYKNVNENYFMKNIKFYEALYKNKMVGVYDKLSRLENIQTSIFKSFVENNGGIIDTLFEMVNDEDPRFMIKFYESISVPLDILKREISPNSASYLYVFNIYTMLEAYKNNKDNYLNYEKIVDDVALIFIPLCEKNQDNNYSNFENKKKLISSIVKIENYKDLKAIQRLLKNLLVNIEERTSDEASQRLDKMFGLYREFFSDLRKMNKLGYSISKELIYEITNEISLLVNDDLLPGVYPYYSSLFIIGDRYKYFKEKIKVVNPYYRKEVFDFIKKLSPGIFVTKDNKIDYFKEYMDCVFNSDTYYELQSKLDVLRKASDEYRNTNPEINLLEELNDYKHKEHFDDITICYEENSNNKIEKPSTIDRRMITLYRKYNLVSEKFNLEKQRDTIDALITEINDEMWSYNKGENIAQDLPQEEPIVKKKSRFLIFDKR